MRLETLALQGCRPPPPPPPRCVLTLSPTPGTQDTAATPQSVCFFPVKQLLSLAGGCDSFLAVFTVAVIN